MKDYPDVTPDFVMIDGNGMLHPRKFGIACHIGVATDIPTIGVAKNYYSLETHYSEPGELTAKQERSKLLEKFKDLSVGDDYKIKHPKDDSVCGLAVRNAVSSKTPIFISVGHKVSLYQAKILALRTTRYKIPEPTRHADILGREYIRKKYKYDVKQNIENKT